MKVKVKVSQSYPILCDPMDYTVREILQARILEWVTFPSPGNLPNPGIKPRFPVLQADSLPAEPQGEPKNTGVGSLSLLQLIFLTQESKQSLLHCRQILYQLSNEGSPEEPEIKLPKSVELSINQESCRKTLISALLTMPKPLTVWITINCGKFLRDENTRPPDLPLEKSVCRSGSNS